MRVPALLSVLLAGSFVTASKSLVDPYSTFVQHFSAEASANDVYLQDRFTEIFANTSVTVTQDRYFDLLRYAAEQPEKVLVRELDNVERLKRVVYAPSRRRRDGPGRLGESSSFAAYQIGFGEHELQAYVLTWSEGFFSYVQWHLIGDSMAAHKLIKDTAAWCSTLRNAILVFDDGYWKADHNLWRAVQKASWDDVILDEDFKHRLTNDYRSFFKSEKTYKDLQVPWKRGLVLLGPRGNGKTISLKAIMNEIKFPSLYVKSFRSYGGPQRGIRDIFQRARAEAPCVLIMEDLDSLIDDENRSFFLNEVDGLEDNDGLLLIGTTNHFDRLDPALSSRPSRFDRKYTFPDPKQKERRAYALYWQNKLKSNMAIKFPDSLLDKIAERTERFSFAYLKEAFVSTLLTLAQRDDDSDKGHDFPEVLLDQIKRLREQLDDDKDQLRRVDAHRHARPPALTWPETPAQPLVHHHDDRQVVMGQREAGIVASTIEPGVKFSDRDSVRIGLDGERKTLVRSEDSICLVQYLKVGPDGEEVPIDKEDIPEHIRREMEEHQLRRLL